MTDLFCRNLQRWQAGQPLMNYLSDKHLGFPIRGGGYPLWGKAGTGRFIGGKLMTTAIGYVNRANSILLSPA